MCRARVFSSSNTGVLVKFISLSHFFVCAFVCDTFWVAAVLVVSHFFFSSKKNKKLFFCPLFTVEESFFFVLSGVV